MSTIEKLSSGYIQLLACLFDWKDPEGRIGTCLSDLGREARLVRHASVPSDSPFERPGSAWYSSQSSTSVLS